MAWLVGAAVAFAACDGGSGGADDGEATDPAAPSDGESGPDGQPGAEAAPDPPLPEIVTIDPTDVEADTGVGGLDDVIASAVDGLPDGWVVAVVPDPELGPYVVGLPAGSTVWRVGDDLGALQTAAGDGPWWRFWEPILQEAGEASSTSSLRSAVALTDADSTPVSGDGGAHLTITATPLQDLPADDPADVADRFAETFEDQGLTVDEVGTADAGDDEVAALALTTPADEFDDGIPRALRQWFYPDAEASTLWSVTCEAPAPATDMIAQVCDPLLPTFRPPPR